MHFNIPIYSDQPWLPQGLDTSNHQGDAALSLDAFCDWLPALFEAKLPKLPGASKSEGEALAANKGYLHALKSSPRRLRKMGMWNDVKHVFFFWGFDVFCICGRMWMGVQFWTSSSIRTGLGWKLATQSRVDQQMHCCFAGPGGSIDVVHWLRQMFLQWWALPCLTQIIYNTYPWLWLYPSCN